MSIHANIYFSSFNWSEMILQTMYIYSTFLTFFKLFIKHVYRYSILGIIAY